MKMSTELTSLMHKLLEEIVACIKYTMLGWTRFHYKYEIFFAFVSFTLTVGMVHVTMQPICRSLT
jgi:hypothetical protein